ncbi:MAG: (E)-4-hydroxy-3-methylbut-2-enyl-diphosphate synthase [Marinilabiliaceae bacterium]|nr:(E)-4-hydroxy-3-methylbut-2-enyl-diphosphate synthase [Marinilabiliaceae bacterium]
MKRESKEITIGSLSLGGSNPVRLQSMANTNTLNTKASVAQAIRIIEAGGELLRFTAQGIPEAENLANIKKEIRRAGFDTPLVADIHFNPAVAELAATIVEKVRINPGNYADKRASFRKEVYSDLEYSSELERIHNRLLPLIKRCRDHGTAVRIGVNHGSLSDRIMTRYGNTPLGMTESAMEFIRIFKAENFDRLVLSMKSSNSLLMVEATEKLVEMMKAEGSYYPLHLGVTEAGEGEDGRIRSALGIGKLLAKGIGDTIRVSLSEAPEKELPVARQIVKYAEELRQKGELPADAMHLRGNPKTYWLRYNCNNAEELSLRAAVDASLMCIPRRIDDIRIVNTGTVPATEVKSISDGILQAARIKISRNDYISCPTCGRTKFSLGDAVSKVKKATSHLKGLKIAIMGCIVNGPGEMADADYGYIGAGNGKVMLYRRQTLVHRNISEDEALDLLLQMISEDTDKKTGK